MSALALPPFLMDSDNGAPPHPPFTQKSQRQQQPLQLQPSRRVFRPLVSPPRTYPITMPPVMSLPPQNSSAHPYPPEYR